MKECTNPKIGKMLALYEFESLTPEEKEKFEQHLLQCDFCFREVYEFSPAVDIIRENIDEFHKAVSIKQPIFAKIKFALFSFFADIYPFSKKKTKRKPRDFLIPGFASIMACVLIILIFKPKFIYNPVVITDKGKPQKIVLHDPEEMEAKATMEEIHRKINVVLSEDKKEIVITWQEIAETQFYNVYLIQNGEKKRLTPSAGIQETSFVFNADILHFDKKYILQVSGKLKQGGDFKITKEFVINKISNNKKQIF